MVSSFWMAPNDPHLLVFTSYVIFFPWNVVWNWWLVLINRIWQIWWEVSSKIKLWNDSGFCFVALFCSLTCSLWCMLPYGVHAEDIREAQAGCPIGTASCQRPCEWAWKQVLPQQSLQRRWQSGWYINYSIYYVLASIPGTGDRGVN